MLSLSYDISIALSCWKSNFGEELSQLLLNSQICVFFFQSHTHTQTCIFTIYPHVYIYIYFYYASTHTYQNMYDKYSIRCTSIAYHIYIQLPRACRPEVEAAARSWLSGVPCGVSLCLGWDPRFPPEFPTQILRKWRVATLYSKSEKHLGLSIVMGGTPIAGWF